jgi:hypothetical protein
MVDNLVGQAIPRRDWQINGKYFTIMFIKLATLFRLPVEPVKLVKKEKCLILFFFAGKRANR